MIHRLLILILCASVALVGCAPKSEYSETSEAIRFSVSMNDVADGTIVGVRGGVAPLSWDQSVPMTRTETGTFTATVPFDPPPKDDTIIPFKFVIENGDMITWETISNRSLPYSKLSMGVEASWNDPFPFDRKTLPELTPEQRLADAQFVIDVISTLHPGILRTLGSDGFEQASQTYLEHVTEAETLEDWLVATYRFLGAIECDHTNAVYNQDALLHGFLFDRSNWLPFASTWQDERLFVTEDATLKGGLPIGTEILAIDGVRSEVIRETIIPMIPSDGPARAPRIAKMNVRGSANEIDLFGAYLSLIYPSQNNQRTLSIVRPGTSTPITITVDLMTRSGRANRIGSLSTRDWTLSFIDEDTAYLTVGTFTPYTLPFNWETFLETAFTEIGDKDVSRLIVDIRQSVGGDSRVGTRLTEYLLDEVCDYDPFTARTRFLNIPARFLDRVGVWDGSSVSLSDRDHETIGPYYEFPSLYSPLALSPRDAAFEGETIILISPNNVSASFYFAFMARHCELGVLAGETTGGSLRGINGGSTLRATLPESGLVINLPYVGSFAKDETDPLGVPADIAFGAFETLSQDSAKRLFQAAAILAED